MGHDVYICYDETDKDLSDAVYNIFEQNNIKSWIKSKDMHSNDPVEITNAISDSKCFVLIFSKNSKDTNYVITEVDIAFSRDIPILIFNIDDSKINRKLEFILENKKIIHSFPNPKMQLGTLVKEVSDVISKPVSNVKTDSKSIRVFEKANPKKTQRTIKNVIKITVPIAIVIVLIYLFVVLPMGQNTTSDGIFSMNITDVDISGTTYTVHGVSYNLPNDSNKYLMNIKFFDNKDNMIFEVNSTADEFKSGVICSCDIHTNNVTHIEFNLIDFNKNVLSKENYIIE